MMMGMPRVSLHGKDCMDILMNEWTGPGPKESTAEVAMQVESHMWWRGRMWVWAPAQVMWQGFVGGADVRGVI
jgi:hypothetical protein